MKKSDEKRDELNELQSEYRSAISPVIDRVMLLGSVRKAVLDAEHEVMCQAEEARWKPRDVFAVGDRVVIKGSALFAMGQRTGRDAALVWTVVECGCELCKTGRLVAVDQWVEDIGWRHIGRAALRHVGQPTVDELPVWATTADTAAIQDGLRNTPLPPARRPANDISEADANELARTAYLSLTRLGWMQ